VLGRRHIAAGAEDALEAEERAPWVRRDHGEPAMRCKHALDRGERRRLIWKVLERTDEQNKLEPLRTIPAEFGSVADKKSQGSAAGAALRACDHGGADVDTCPAADELGEMDENLASAATEIEDTGATEVAAKHTQVADASSKFRRTRRSRAVLCIPVRGNDTELPAQIR
jgi:hypothetical protein